MRADNGDISLDQNIYAAKVIEESFEKPASPVKTPLPEDFNKKINEPSEKLSHIATACRSALGKMNYLRHTRCELLYLISQLSRVKESSTRYSPRNLMVSQVFLHGVQTSF